MRVGLGFWSLLCWSLLPPSAQATELVRVLLFQDVQRVEVAAGEGMVARFSNGDERPFETPLVVSLLADGIGVNGDRLQTEGVTVRGRHDLIVTVEGQDGAQKPDRPAERAAVFLRSSSKTPVASSGPATGLRVAEPMGAMVVSGTLQVVRRAQGLMVINEVDLEEYVKGVVPSEVSSSWHQEALKVQAVAARTYALYQRMINAGGDYHLMSSIQDQVYRGRNGVDPRVQQAVEDTRGIVITYLNAPILAAFSSTAAGQTEDAVNVWSKDLPYLKGVECPFDTNSPYYQWRTSFKVVDLETNLRQKGMAVGTIASVTPLSYSRAGRVARVRILHSHGELILRGEDLRRVVGYAVIPSTQFEIEAVGSELVLSGYGAGHAVGLCQWGAKELAEQGYPFPVIIRYYFPGTELKDARLVESVSPSTP
ncbi:MAG TPA: SpoIID/LytB domain-containing protein [Nitrospiraceae bacterium]|nr:SpoIID/LytB domain-containing protein [Nitrospiraceae bacterium]